MVTRLEATDPDEVRPDDKKKGAGLAQDNNTASKTQQISRRHVCFERK